MIGDALSVGLERARQCVRWLGVAYLVSLALALPLGAAMADQLRDAIGPSEAGEALLSGFDHLWWRGFDAEAQGLGATFEPGVVGAGGVLKALDTLVTATLFDLHESVIAAGIAYLVAWVFLSAGFLARFTDARAGGFLHGATRHFPRVLALSVVSWLAYAAIFGLVLEVGAAIVDAATYETIDERVHFAWVLGKYAVVWGLVWGTSLVFDYAKIVAVARPDAPLRSAFGVAAGLVCTRARPVLGLSAALFAIGAGLLLLYAVIAPGADQHNGFKIAIAFVVSQTYVVARVTMRCATLGAQTRLAHELKPGLARPTAGAVL